MLLYVIIIVIGLFIIIKVNSPEYKGKSGEKLVAERLDIINGYKYILNNIILNDNGKSRQIDHIAITEYGVYVIETKNYSGSIYGKENSNKWKQYLNHKCYEFENPIHQNYGHLQIVNKNIQDITTNVYSIITFIRRCNLKVDTSTVVLYEDQLAQYIKNRQKVLTIEQIDKIYNRILENQVTNKDTIKNHSENVKLYKEYKEDLIKNQICPRCHGKLVKRTGKKGEFYGCSNFPKCKYTKEIENIKYYEVLK